MVPIPLPFKRIFTPGNVSLEAASITTPVTVISFCALAFETPAKVSANIAIRLNAKPRNLTLPGWKLGFEKASMCFLKLVRIFIITLNFGL